MQSKSIAVALAVALVVVALTATFLSSGVFADPKTAALSRVKASVNLGVYSDSACTQNLASVDWGTVSAGGSFVTTFYVKNLGTVPLRVYLSSENWNPAAANGVMALNWNLDGVAHDVERLFPNSPMMSLKAQESPENPRLSPRINPPLFCL